MNNIRLSFKKLLIGTITLVTFGSTIIIHANAELVQKAYRNLGCSEEDSDHHIQTMHKNQIRTLTHQIKQSRKRENNCLVQKKSACIAEGKTVRDLEIKRRRIDQALNVIMKHRHPRSIDTDDV